MKIFHHNDLDGRLSAFIVNYFSKQKGSYFELNYNKTFPLDIIEKNEKVYIVDFSIKPDIMKKLLEITDNVIWIDHHKSAIEEYNFFSPELPGVRQIGLAGCVLTYLYMQTQQFTQNIDLMCIQSFNPDEVEDKVPYYIRLVGDYDVWAWKYGHKTDLFIHGMYSYDTSPASKIWENLSFSYPLVENIMSEGAIVKRYRDINNADYTQNWAFEVDFEGYRCIALNKAQCGSQTFDSLKDKNYDILIPFVWDGSKYVFSMYTTRTDLDLSLLAKKYGGGGHAQAAGASCKELPFTTIER